MRTFSNWRDLPPIPRVGAKKFVKVVDSDEFIESPCTASDSSLVGRRTRSEYNSEIMNSDSEEEIFVSRKRARHGTPNRDKSDAGQDIQKDQDFPGRHSGKPQLSGHAVLKCAVDTQSESSKHLTTSPVSEANATLGNTDNESSDEEAVLPVIRRRRKRSRTGNSPTQERRFRSNSLRSATRDQSCSSDDSGRQHRISAESKKRRRSSSPMRSSTGSKRRRKSNSPERDRKEERRVLRRPVRSHKLVSKTKEDVEEPLLFDSSPVSECDRSQRRSSGSTSRRRRCARQSTGSVTVPWYLLDEERKPRKLRSSSRNYAARCIYWTRTEHRLFYIDKSPIHNRGLYAREDIPAYAPVIEYAGEVISQVQSEIREWAYQTRHMEEVYMYQLRKGTTNVIDGTLRGGPAKFVNHSCEPNVVAEEIHAGDMNRVWFFSLRRIRKYEEILVDYCLSYEPGDVRRPCNCHARNCRKFLNYYGLPEQRKSS